MPIKILLGELLDRSNIIIKEIIYIIQYATSQYYIRRAPKAKVIKEEPSIASLVLAASVQKHLLEVTTYTQDNNR